MKRILSFVLAVVMIFLTASLTVSAVEDDFVYTISEDGTYYILTEYRGSATEVTVPSAYNELPVKVIGEASFQHKDTIEKVTLPSTITEIQTYAFAHCYELVDINIPSAVTYIGSCAFSDCFGLREIAIPSSVQKMDLEVFRRCSEDMKIYFESASAPEGFSPYWMSSAANPPTAYWNYYKRGDVDGDGESVALDYLMIRRTVMGTYTCTKKQTLACDVDGDGTIVALDYIMLRRAVMGTYTLD
jgi:hypothetical protein